MTEITKPRRKRVPAAANTEGAPLAEITQAAERILGWAPRITVYIDVSNDAGKKKLKETMEDKLFTVQHADLTKQLTVGGYTIREMGALADEKTMVNARIVRVMLASEADKK